MLKLSPYLRYDGNCNEAIETYLQAFDAKLKVKLHYRDPDCYPNPTNENKDYIWHCQLVFGEQILMLADNSDNILDINTPTSCHNILCIMLDTVEEVEQAYNILSKGATIITPIHSSDFSARHVTLEDRFGIVWDIMVDFNA